MNIIANNVASKLFVAFVAAAMLFTLATPAKAATAEELQAQIAALMAQISALQGGSSSSSAACTFTRSLTVGSEGADVKCLQDALTPTYFNNAGGSTGYFGPVTASAVAAWQTANGVSPAVGYFGPVSQAKFAATMTSGGSDDSSDDSDDSSDDSSSDLSGEGSLNTFEIEDGEDVEVEEGQVAESVQDFVVEFEDGDAMITRLDVELNTDATDDSWDIFGEVTLYVDGEEVASKDGSDEDSYQSDDMTLRFSGLDVVAMEDEELTITLGVEVQDNLDDNAQVVTVDVTGMRYVDADDVTTTETASEIDADTNTFSIVAAGSEDELIVKSATSDPASDTFVVEEDTIKSGWETIFAFDLDTDDSVNDLDINTIGVLLTAGTADVDMVVDDAELVIDGVTYTDWDWASTTDDDNSRDMTFDVDGDHTIDAGDRVTAELRVKFFGTNAGAQFAEGETIQASASTSLFDIEGVEDVTATGGATGDEHTLRSSGVSVTDFDGSSSVDNKDTAADSTASFVFEFTVEAIGEEEIYVPLNTAIMDASASSTKGVVYRLEDSNGALVASTSLTSLSAVFQHTGGDGDTDTAGYLHLNTGDIANVKLSVTINPTTAGYYTLILDSVNFKMTSAGAADQATALTPESDYDETTSVSVTN